MPRSLNQVTLLGNTGNDPEVRRFGQRAVASFSLATSESWKDKTTGEWKEATQWHRVKAWSPVAETVEKYVKKGSRVLVQGKVKYEKWEDREGVERYATIIEIRELVLLDAKSASSPAPAAAAPQGFDEFPDALKDDDNIPF